MPTAKRIVVDGKPIAGGKLPVTCAPLVGADRAQVLAEAAAVVANAPDVIEWRVDYFERIGAFDEVAELARALRDVIGGRPIIFTRRSAAEGGRPVKLSEDEVVALYAAVCAARCVDLVDYEVGNPADRVGRVGRAAKEVGVGFIGSFHDFKRTPPLEELRARFLAAERAGADVAKVAVMPAGPEDVLTLLQATQAADRALGVPVISMAMGVDGAVTRVAGWLFGSVLTFGVGKGSSAPGQLPLGDLRAAIEILQRSSTSRG